MLPFLSTTALPLMISNCNIMYKLILQCGSDKMSIKIGVCCRKPADNIIKVKAIVNATGDFQPIYKFSEGFNIICFWRYGYSKLRVNFL